MASGSDKAPDQPRQLSAEDFVADTFLANILGFALTQNSKSMANLGGSATQAQVWNLLIFFYRGPVELRRLLWSTQVILARLLATVALALKLAWFRG